MLELRYYYTCPFVSVFDRIILVNHIVAFEFSNKYAFIQCFQNVADPNVIKLTVLQSRSGFFGTLCTMKNYTAKYINALLSSDNVPDCNYNVRKSSQK